MIKKPIMTNDTCFLLLLILAKSIPSHKSIYRVAEIVTPNLHQSEKHCHQDNLAFMCL